MRQRTETDVQSTACTGMCWPYPNHNAAAVITGLSVQPDQVEGGEISSLPSIRCINCRRVRVDVCECVRACEHACMCVCTLARVPVCACGCVGAYACLGALLLAHAPSSPCPCSHACLQGCIRVRYACLPCSTVCVRRRQDCVSAGLQCTFCEPYRSHWQSHLLLIDLHAPSAAPMPTKQGLSKANSTSFC